MYNLNYTQKKYFSFSYILYTDNNKSSYNSQQLEAEELDRLEKEEQDRLARAAEDLEKGLSRAQESRAMATFHIASAIERFSQGSRPILSSTTRNSIQEKREKYDGLDKKVEEELDKENDEIRLAYLERCDLELDANRHKAYIDAMLEDLNITRESQVYLMDLKDQMEKCRKEDVRLSEFNIEYLKEADDLVKSFAAARADLKRSYEENRASSSEENRAPCSDENRAYTTEESSKVDKSKSTEEESSSVYKGKASEEGSTKEDKGKRKASEEEAYEGETKRSRVDGPSLLPPQGGVVPATTSGDRNSDENRRSLVEDFADVSTEMPSYMDPDDG